MLPIGQYYQVQRPNNWQACDMATMANTQHHISFGNVLEIRNLTFEVLFGLLLFWLLKVQRSPFS